MEFSRAILSLFSAANAIKLDFSWPYTFLGQIHILRVCVCVCACGSVLVFVSMCVPNPKMYCAAAEVARFRQRRCPTNYPQRTERGSCKPVANIVADSLASGEFSNFSLPTTPCFLPGLGIVRASRRARDCNQWIFLSALAQFSECWHLELPA